MNNVSIKQLRYFVAVADTGQIRLASKRLNISSSAITDSLKGLERNLDTILLTRHHKGMMLTPNGQSFYRQASSILNQLDQSVMSLTHGSLDLVDTLNISTTISIMGYFLPTPLKSFQVAYPNLNIQVTELPRTHVEQALLTDKTDIAVMILSNMEHRIDLHAETLFNSRRSLWCSINHPFARVDEVSIHEIAQQPYIQLTSDEADRNTQEFLSLHNTAPSSIIKTGSVEAVRSMVANNQGVTILSDLLFRPWSLDGGQLQSQSVVEMIPSMNVGLAWRKNRKKKQAVDAFIEFLKQNFSSNRNRPTR